MAVRGIDSRLASGYGGRKCSACRIVVTARKRPEPARWCPVTSSGETPEYCRVPQPAMLAQVARIGRKGATGRQTLPRGKNAAKCDATMAPKNCNASGFVGGPFSCTGTQGDASLRCSQSRTKSRLKSNCFIWCHLEDLNQPFFSPQLYRVLRSSAPDLLRRARI